MFAAPIEVKKRLEARSSESRRPNWASVIRSRRLIDLNISQERVVEGAHDAINQVKVSRVERGQIHPVNDLKSNELLGLISGLDWSVEEFIAATGLEIPFYNVVKDFVAVSEDDGLKRQIPLYDGVGAGEGSDWGSEIGTVTIPIDWGGEYVGFLVNGDSMDPKIPDGSTVVARLDVTPDLGDYVVAHHPDHGLIVKQLVISNGEQAKAALKSKNPDYALVLLGEGCEIRGVVRRIIPQATDLW